MRFLTTTAIVVAMATPALAWQEDYQVLRFGILSGENEADRIERWTPFADYLEETLGVEVEIFTAANYDGVIQAMAADQIEFAWFGSSSYAAAYTATEGAVMPLLSRQRADGSTGYFSIITVRCDSGFESLDDLEGMTLAFADPDSTSGYAVPFYNLVQQGIDPDTYFNAIPFSGSHEAGVQGVFNGTFDAAATWFNNEDSGVYQRMEDGGIIPAGEICHIWQSPEITSGPFTTRVNLPEDLIADMTAAVMAFPTADTEAFDTVHDNAEGNVNNTIGYVPVDHERYQWIVDMRQWLRDRRRS